MHDMSRSHIRLVVNPKMDQGLKNDEKEKRGQMVSALEAIGDAANSEEAFAALQSWNHSPGTLKADAYEVEQELNKGGMEVLRLMLEENFRSRGAGDVGPSIEARPKEQEIEEQRHTDEKSEEREFVRLGKRRPHVRNYESLFGMIHIERLGYGECGQRSIHPLDEELNLPGRKYSYVLQERGARRCGRGPFDEAVDELQKTVAGKLPKRQMEQVAVDAAKDFSAFYEQQSKAVAPTTESGSIITCGIDCKGIPKRKTEQEKEKTRRIRLGKGEKSTKKKMATVASLGDRACITIPCAKGKDDMFFSLWLRKH